MIRNKENLDYKYWGNHLPFEFEITHWEKKQLRDYFINELKMSNEHELDFESNEIKLIVDICRRITYNLS
jgi:hypothetical protein